MALGVAGAVLVLAIAGPLSASVQLPLSAVGVAAMVVGARRRGRRGAGWWGLAAGYALWLAGDAVHVAALAAGFDGAGSPAAPLYLAAYLPMAAGLLMLTRDAGAQHWRARALEGGIAAVGLALLACVVVVGPALASTRRVAADHVLGASYLVGDVVLLSQAVVLLAASRWRAAGPRLGAAGVAVVLSCDATWVLWGDHNPYQSVLAVGVLVSNLLWAAAALHPDAERRDVDAEPATMGLLPAAGLTAALVLPSALLGVLVLLDLHGSGGADPRRDGGWEDGWLVWAVVAAGTAMAVLVVARTALAVRAAGASVTALEGLARTLERQAAHDPLTGLANRATSRARLASALRSGRREGRGVALLFVDLDGFKAVNDTHGHRAGDEVLRAVAGRTTSCVRSSDVVGRLGGDEFVVVLTSARDQDDVMALARRLVADLSAPMTADGHEVAVGASVGAAWSPDGQAEADVLLHEADTAVYRAKAGGRGCAVLFDEALRAEVAARAALEADLRAALAADQLDLHYQPVLDLRAGRADGLEALLRWNHPQRGPLQPEEFVPLAERSELVCDLGRWVLRTAAAQQAAWARARGDHGPIVGVNIAPRHLASSAVVDDVAQALQAAGVRPGRFVVEVTETDVVGSGPSVEHLQAIRALGVLVAIDDFGTGYTSIGQLRRLPCDLLKIDRSLVTSREPGALELLALAVRAGHAVGALVAVEGVETREHEAVVRAAGADLGQGWLWSRALPAAELDDLVVSGGRPALLPSVLRAPAAG
ncbi:EAL domain-containing protein [Streptomyces sp. NP160]|nr:EAL domain-containing protein [Streptomyces sp. NP160]